VKLVSRRKLFQGAFGVGVGIALAPAIRAYVLSDDDRFAELLATTGAVIGGTWRLNRRHILRNGNVIRDCRIIYGVGFLLGVRLGTGDRCEITRSWFGPEHENKNNDSALLQLC